MGSNHQLIKWQFFFVSVGPVFSMSAATWGDRKGGLSRSPCPGGSRGVTGCSHEIRRQETSDGGSKKRWNSQAKALEIVQQNGVWRRATTILIRKWMGPTIVEVRATVIFLDMFGWCWRTTQKVPRITHYVETSWNSNLAPKMLMFSDSGNSKVTLLPTLSPSQPHRRLKNEAQCPLAVGAE
jgi:hypothetical protein